MAEENKLQEAQSAQTDVIEQSAIAAAEQVEEHHEHRGEHHHHGEQHHHSHHHSGHSHSHSHHRHKRKKESKLKTFLKKHKSVLINILFGAVSVVLLVVLALNMDFFNGGVQNDHMDVTQSTIKIETSVYTNKISLVSDAISYYVSQNDGVSANQIYKSFEGDRSGLNRGMPVKFTYRISGLPAGVDVSTAQLQISENAEYSDALTYVLELDKPNIEVYNLKTGTQYYYRVTLTLKDDCTIGTTGTFETKASPRILAIDGTVNVRDMGGWKTADGTAIRQGLVYRGSELDGAVQPEYMLTERGKQQMLFELGVRFDMDLRSPNENKGGADALGKAATHKYYGLGMYSDLLTDRYAAMLRELFADLADPANYPVYIHCTYGRDRTGSVCYLLGALLGMTEEDLRKDYALSAFTDGYINDVEFDAFAEKVNSFPGETVQQKVEGYLRSIGVTLEEIAAIREQLLEN